MVRVVERDVVPVVVDVVGEQEDLGPGVVVNVGGLGNHDGRLGAAAPPCVGVDLVVLDGDIVPLVHPDPAVGTVVHLVVVDPDVVPGPGHDAPPTELVGLDQSVLHGLAVSDVVIGSDNLQAGDLYPGHVGHHDPASPVKLQHGGVVGQVGQEDVVSVLNKFTVFKFSLNHK